MSGSSTLPSLMGEDPLRLDDEFFPPPSRLSSRSQLQLTRRSSGDSYRERQEARRGRDEDSSDTESLASVSTVSSVDPLSDHQIGYIALDDELQDSATLAGSATSVLNHNFSLSPVDGCGLDSIDQAVARLSAANLADVEGAEGARAGTLVNGVPHGPQSPEGPELRTPVGETAPAPTAQ
ncbi:uncharacterized protein LOC119099275 [Pollicipes pollicipes]|uniref:uncharacterized protein LOC119099275 n=1 Tax=Pollicipes pollicipes TaxID=41117 RepID=UPI001884F3B4|nr:uncharacterized protein LOC119099275 [Pollicipes pollicipes]